MAIDYYAEELIALRAPEYATDTRLPMYIELADEFVGDKIPEITPREYAKALQVLHWLTMSDRVSDGNGATGSILEEKEGELRIKYGSTNGNSLFYTSDMKGELGQTVWGIELYSFIKRYIVLATTRFSA